MRVKMLERREFVVGFLEIKVQVELSLKDLKLLHSFLEPYIGNFVCSLFSRLELLWLDLIEISTTTKFSKFCSLLCMSMSMHLC
jgi:hypothetical protein